MKFNEEFFPSKKIWTKPFLIMKMIILLMTAFCIQASATGQKISIVKDTPGVTRDRIYADIDWLNYNFTMIDTYVRILLP